MRAIWTAVQQPGIKAVAVKSEGRQAVLGLQMPRGRAEIRRDVLAALGRLAERLPAVVIDTPRERCARVSELDEQVQQIERRLLGVVRHDDLIVGAAP
ncbi:MAG: hypothetical protein IT480_12820 [Gammaproteobacteria bacterium]|nr:hypothetical protein [Gammaproteobacteria bacterium]